MTMATTKIKLGAEGERLAVQRLIEIGYEIIECNYRSKMGEIDIIAKDQHVICFIEVKMRTSDEQGHPLESITVSKQRKISLSALSYLQEHELLSSQEARFDVVSIMENEGSIQVEIIQNGFESCV